MTGARHAVANVLYAAWERQDGRLGVCDDRPVPLPRSSDFARRE